MFSAPKRNVLCGKFSYENLYEACNSRSPFHPFDGYVAHIAHHGSYKTRYDYLIYCGPCRETDFYGPMFQFEDVNYSDFHFEGEDAPDTVSLDMNLHIIARIVEYKEISGLFILDPVSVTQIKEE